MNTHQITKQSQINNEYSDSVKILTSKNKFYINLGLDRMNMILKLLNNPQNNFKSIQVAGTNGKGSVCSMLSSILKEYGYKVGLYTSPHIFEYTERIKINNIDISQNDFSKYLNEVITISEKNDIPLTEFEILTSMMFKYFSDNKIDIAIIETGLGGRLDATNILNENLCSVITHIDLDHTERLGETKDKIAYEKAGIIKENSKTITNEPYDIINQTAQKKNSTIVKGDIKKAELMFQHLNLKGQNQIENLSLVLSAIDKLFPQINNDVIINGLKNVHHPCRFEYIKEKNLIIDGAHNPNCFKELRKNLDMYYPDIPKQYIFGCLNNKDYKNMLKFITNDKNLLKLYFYEFNNPNACDFKTLQSYSSVNAHKLNDKNEIVYSSDILTVICGSFYMIKELI